MIMRTLGRLDAFVLASIISATSSFAWAQNTERVRTDVTSTFYPTGFMGDGEYQSKYIQFTTADRTAPRSTRGSVKISYTFGTKGWGGFYWQNIPDNWGDKPGRDLSSRGYTFVTFWAKGALGGEAVEFKVGGINDNNKKHKDSFIAFGGTQQLTKEWKQYKIELGSQDLSSVIGGFVWVANRNDNPGSGKIVFFIEDVQFE